MSNNEKKQSENGRYDMKKDFVNLAIVILLLSVILFSLYFYDKQSDVLKTVPEQIVKLFQ